MTGIRVAEPLALGVYGAALREAALGGDGVLQVLDETGTPLRRIDPVDWITALRPGDGGLLARCGAATLDIGCGPGRLVATLARAGRDVLGIDISAEAVRQARRRGAPALRADVFGPVPRAGGWRTVLLADGNIGIGGDPVALLGRCGQLLRGDGSVLLELAAPGDRSWRGNVRLQFAHRRSALFPWAVVSADDIAAVAAPTRLRLGETWTEEGRWFARLDG